MTSLFEKIIIGFVIAGAVILGILYMLYLLVNAIKDWIEANPSWAALLTLLLIVLLLAVFIGFIRWIEER